MILKDGSSKSKKKKQKESKRLILAILFAITTPWIAPRAEEKSSKSSDAQTLTPGSVQAASAAGAATFLGTLYFTRSSRCAQSIKDSIGKLDSAPTPLGRPGTPLPQNAIAENIRFTRLRTPFRAKDYESQLSWRKKLEPFEKLKQPKLIAFLRDELSKMIETGYGLLSPRELQNFHEAVRDFIDQRGHFVIDQDIDPQLGHTALFNVTDKGEAVVYIPYVTILKSAAGGSYEQQSALGDTLHEIRHYVTYVRVARSLEKQGLAKPEARTYLDRLRDYPESYAYLIDQFEQEARTIERRVLPHTIEDDIKDFLYADLEALQQWTTAYLSPSIQGSLESLPNQSPAIRLADRIALQTEQYFTDVSDGRELPALLKVNLKAYVKNSNKDKDLGRNVLFELLVNHMFRDMEGRLDSNAETSLKSLILTRLQAQRRRIDSAIQKLLKAHPEIKPSDIK